MMNALTKMNVILSSNAHSLEDENSKYIDWIFSMVLRNKEKAKGIYYLLLGFCGDNEERRCRI